MKAMGKEKKVKVTYRSKRREWPVLWILIFWLHSFFIYISLKNIDLYLAVCAGSSTAVQAFSSCSAWVSHCGGFSLFAEHSL